MTTLHYFLRQLLSKTRNKFTWCRMGWYGPYNGGIRGTWSKCCICGIHADFIPEDSPLKEITNEPIR